jgi:putative SOS response-associated peptidase YedK
MCGRYTFYTEREIQDLEELLKDLEDELDQEKIRKGDIYPSDRAPVVVAPKTPKVMTWGFPGFKGKGLIINARSEGLMQKPAFRKHLARGRCLIVADGFYEWRQRPGQPEPFYFSLGPGKMMALAGLFQTVLPGGNHGVIITVPANQLVGEVHRRMPAIMAPERYRDWLDPDLSDPEALLRMLEPWPLDGLGSCRVGTMVNSPGNDTPECIRPV